MSGDPGVSTRAETISILTCFGLAVSTENLASAPTSATPSSVEIDKQIVGVLQ